MKKLGLIAFVFGMVHLAWAQTIKPVAIPGTHVSLLPVSGFKLSQTFFGLQKDTATGIQVYDYTNRSYYESIIGFSDSEMKNKGAVLYIYKQLKVDGYDARYAVLQGDSGTKVTALLFGDSTFTAMVMAAYPEKDAALEKQIEQAITAAKYNKKAKVDPFALSVFKLNDASSKWKYVKNAGDNMYMYALNGEMKDSYMSESSFTAIPVNSDTALNAEALAKQVLEDMKKYGLNEANTTYQSAKPINGYSAYELITYGTVAKEKHAVYHMAVVKGNRGFVVQGIAVSDFEIVIQQFEELAHTVIAK